ncbi:hypothetical protein [Endozoicomonas arenosclerae]|uniref:hypothetical protein n=1 Tax=Endozoicomonas arenosclerae TaxID=1633495 RepID=UPI0007845FB0|nr:hypothetical protein [Endozoicomonas arenosclerae]
MIKTYRKYRLTVDVLTSLFLIGVAIAVVSMKYSPESTIEFISIDFLEPALRFFATAPTIVNWVIAGILLILGCLKFVLAFANYKTATIQNTAVPVSGT